MRTHSPARALVSAHATVSAFLIVAVLSVSACGSTDGTGTVETSPGSTTATTSPTTSIALPPSANQHPSMETAAPRPDHCLIGELQVTVGHVDGAAGSQEIPLVFTNIGNRTCVLQGYPGVSYVATPDGAQVGSAATRDGGSGSPVTLSPGKRVTAPVRATVVQNYPAETCGPTPVAGFRVYPPNDTGSVFVPYPTTGCSQTGTGVDQLSVQPVTG
ncbi:DUF4232 domain-containing protein [Rhodococcus marinonascens]|uniref:DUF4232 domain-containing protein n=1 Tax=Rhodococcus marinonascens TaxID=38311 RepID=UPI0009329ED7|nr:DUF4232 domain-containing protein [Rhodococcus marinonascens]